ncbi:TauD/TfdA family dioxygenase [Saccharopolyspora indica]|uniref:TauD/TfdA family dioxygenase n=1 Tax=Saccharopolyspora indica TaxID=1229659 RepID=UPI0022EAEBB4|nr:TauD/TfdA family dioxygenase [Saccharopolyspora indica]MDA3649694.1 TauD/TfdA family dioxygenase [Saccharopolyspora indica]
MAEAAVQPAPVDVLREPCRAAWKPADLGAEWQFELAPAHLGEIEFALRTVRKYGISLLNLTLDRFPLPTLGFELQRIARELECGRGFAVLKGIPVGRYDVAEINTIFWGMAQHLGVPVSQDAFGRKLARVRCERELRTGGSDVVALQGSGGRSTVVSSAALYNEVLRRDPGLVERMYRRFPFDRWGEQLPGEPPYRSVPLACWHEGKLSFRYARRDIESAQRFPGADRLEPADVALFDLIDELAEEVRFDVDAEPGDIQLFNNYSVLHAHSDSAVAELPRRLWLTLHDGRRLPAEFTWGTGGYGAPRGRGGVEPRDIVDPGN